MPHSTRIDIYVSANGHHIEVDSNGHTVFSGSTITPQDLQHILNKVVPDAKLHLNHDFEAHALDDDES